MKMVFHFYILNDFIGRIEMSDIIINNCERKAKIYRSSGNKFTNSSSVNNDTPLEELNLNWSEKDLPERERTKHVHRLHPYLGKFIPQLVEIFLRKYFKPGQTILDPFCGSGTTLVQANELGINSIGFDVSAFNVLLTRVKTDKYNIGEATGEILDILYKLEGVKNQEAFQLEIWGNSTPKKMSIDTSNTDEYLKDWFAPQSLRELLTYKYFIDSGKYKYKNLLRVILSRSARSSRLTTHFDLDFPKKPQREPYWCYKHSKECQPVQEAFKFLRRYSIDTIERIKEFSKIRTNAQITVKHTNSLGVSIPPIDGVITSPPYVGLIDYHRQHIYAYHLLNLEDRSEDEIGAASNGSSRVAKEKYKADISGVFSHIAASMRSGGRMIIVANDRANLYDEIAEIAGMDVEGIVQRLVNRRTGRRSTEFFESVFIWRKP